MFRHISDESCRGMGCYNDGVLYTIQMYRIPTCAIHRDTPRSATFLVRVAATWGVTLAIHRLSMFHIVVTTETLRVVLQWKHHSYMSVSGRIYSSFQCCKCTYFSGMHILAELALNQVR